MSDWKITGAITFDQGIAETSTTQKTKLGTVVIAVDVDTSTDVGMGEFVYCLGVASTVATDVCSINQKGYVTTRAVAGGVGQIGLAMSANVASQYGWYQIGGLGIATGSTSDAANKAAFLTATAGKLADAVVTGDKINGCQTATALDTPATGKIYCSLSRPYVDSESSVA